MEFRDKERSRFLLAYPKCYYTRHFNERISTPVFPAAIILNPTINLTIRSLRAIRAITPKRNMYQMAHTRANRNDIFQNGRLFLPGENFCIRSITNIEKSLHRLELLGRIVISSTVHIIMCCDIVFI